MAERLLSAAENVLLSNRRLADKVAAQANPGVASSKSKAALEYNKAWAQTRPEPAVEEPPPDMDHGEARGFFIRFALLLGVLGILLVGRPLSPAPK